MSIHPWSAFISPANTIPASLTGGGKDAAIHHSITLHTPFFSSLTPSSGGRGSSNNPPNILYVILDDVGIDQMRLFGYGGLDYMKTPTLDALATGGVKFRNTWSSPECSPSRVSMLTGRYPIRTNVTNALLPPDLAGNQISPYEVTIPTILRRYARYDTALFGKAHYANTPSSYDTTPYGGTSMTQVGFSEFYGWWNGAPLSIDTTAGGIAPEKTYSCGYIPTTAINSTTGADHGACYYVNGSCEVLLLNSNFQSPGLECLTKGGILVPQAGCTSPPPAHLEFGNFNGYYVGNFIAIPGRNQPYLSFNPEDPSGLGRGYRSTLEANECIKWIKSRCGRRPWFATLSFSSAHTPIQPAPLNLIDSKTEASLPGSQDCSGEAPLDEWMRGGVGGGTPCIERGTGRRGGRRKARQDETFHATKGHHEKTFFLKPFFLVFWSVVVHLLVIITREQYCRHPSGI